MVSQAGTSIRESLEGRLTELDEALAGVEEAKAGQRAVEGSGAARRCCRT